VSDLLLSVRVFPDTIVGCQILP